MVRKIKKQWISQETKLVWAEMFLFLPAITYWLSALIFVTLETDYLFDVVILPASQFWWGIMLITFFITVLPGLGSFGAWMMWNKFENKAGRWLMILGGLMALAGMVPAIIKF